MVFLSQSTNSDDVEVSSSTTDEHKRKIIPKSGTDINYVGKLLEYCIKNKLPPASFDLVEYSSHAQSHLREFHMKCSVNDVEKEGKGFCKKEAKRQAAMEVLNVLQGLPVQTVPKKISTFDEPPSEKRLKIAEGLAVQNEGNQLLLDRSAATLEAKNDKV